MTMEFGLYVTAIGVGLVFAVLLLVLSARPRIHPLLAAIVVALDVLWVLDVGTKIAGGTFSTQGAWAIGFIALAVLDFAAFQALGLYRSRQLRRATAP